MSFSSELFEPFLWCHFNKFFAGEILNIVVLLGPTVAVGLSVLSQKQYFFSVLWLVKYAPFLPIYLPSEFCLVFLLSSDFSWINVLYYCTFRSFSKNTINSIHCSWSSYISSPSFDNHLPTQLSPSNWYKCSDPSLMYSFDSMLCSDARRCKFLIVLMIWLRAAATLSVSFNFDLSFWSLKTSYWEAVLGHHRQTSTFAIFHQHIFINTLH